MGWGAQKGAALVAPVVQRLAADKAKDKVAILKEQRKFAEEMRLRRTKATPDPTKGKGKGETKGAAQE